MSIHTTTHASPKTRTHPRPKTRTRSRSKKTSPTKHDHDPRYHFLYTFYTLLLQPYIHYILTTLTTALQSLAINLIRLGPIPTHIAFIMDGNRRYAHSQSLPTILQGHSHGFSKLEQTLEWCMKLGVEMVSVYAFSIENFKRSEAEVEGLMALAEEKLNLFAEHSDLIRTHQIRVRVLGNTTLLPPNVLTAIQNVTKMTKNHTGPILNICMPYTSRHEIVETVRGVLSHSNNVDEEAFEKYLFTYPNNATESTQSGDVDLLIRTSGETRLSDFLLWQSCTDSCGLYFVKTLWPEFGFWEMGRMVVRWQIGKIINGEGVFNS